MVYTKIALDDLYISIHDNISMQEWLMTRKGESRSEFLDILSFLVHENQHQEIGFYAQKMGVEHLSFSTTVGVLTGMSIRQWLTEYILRSAKELLCTTDMNLTEISSRLGFQCLSTFSRFFKENMGITILKWRKLNRRVTITANYEQVDNQ